MSSEDSYTSTTPRIRQFGLYRSIDSRTEEFLRLSRKRQIRQGCACAAASTAITVTVVVVILLIYEYAIAVEWSLVQRFIGNATNITHDIPYADKLDRNFFGFEQDYYERMPLLVNALQESNYVDPGVEMYNPLIRKPYDSNRTFASNVYKPNFLRKSSPRPFIFEYRSPTPLPFTKKYGARSWIDSYRNSQRLQNIRQVIRYLEKTINAKSADMHIKPTNSHTSIAFSGVYVEPKVEKDKSDESNGMELLQQNSNRVETYANHNEDPLFNFKPDSPGEVNLLADTFFRFAPTHPIPTITSLVNEKEPNKVAMFRRIPYRNICRGNHCNENIDKFNMFKSTIEHITEPSSSTKSLSVMLDLFPMKPTESPEPKRYNENPPLEKIYLTTSKPLIQFRRKPAIITMRRSYYRYKKPKYLTRNKNTNEVRPTVHSIVQKTNDKNNNSTMVVHVDVFSPEDENGLSHKKSIHYTTTTFRPSSVLPSTQKPVKLFAGQVEDHHDGSSGLITIAYPEEINEAATQEAPIQIPTTQAPTSPQVATVVPYLETTTEQNPWATSPPDVFKFSAEDAKIPDQYMTMATTQTIPTNMDIKNMNWHTTPMPYDLKRRNMDVYSTEADVNRLNNNLFYETTKPYELDMVTTEPSMEMDRRSMHLETTQSVPMETVRVNMDWLTTQQPINNDESNDEVNEDKIENIGTETTQANKLDRGKMKWATTVAPTEMDRYGQVLRKTLNDLRERLIIKLRNSATTTGRPNPTSTGTPYPSTTEEIDETTTQNTYVPQINGHYRNIVTPRNQTTRKYSPEVYRKRKLEMSVTGFRSYVPMYTEIKRNRGTSSENTE